MENEKILFNPVLSFYDFFLNDSTRFHVINSFNYLGFGFYLNVF